MAQQILYTMQFKGRAVPANDAGTVLKATTTAPSCTIPPWWEPPALVATFSPQPAVRAALSRK